MATVPSSTITLQPASVRQTLHLSSKPVKARETIAIQFRDCHGGIGVKVIGGEANGIFIKRLLPNKKAILDGRLMVGDQLLRINGRSLENISYEDSLLVLREAAATGQITMVITRDQKAQHSFGELMEEEFTSASECSRASTPATSACSTPAQSEATTPANECSMSPDTSFHSRNSESDEVTPREAPVTLNNSGLTRTLSNNSANRQDIQRLANFFTRRPNIDPMMASTPQNPLKVESHDMQTVSSSANHKLPEQQDTDHTIAHRLFSSIHAGFHPSSLHQNALAQPHPLLLESDMRCTFEKLDTALKFLGLDISPTQKEALRSRMEVDKEGLISYNQYVHAVREMFQGDLKQLELQSMAAQPSQHNYNNITVLQSSHKLVEPTAFNGDHQSDLFDEIRQLQKENFTLRKQVHSLSRQLNEQVQLTCKAEKDLHRFRAESQETLQQTTSLKQKLLLAAESQKIARDQELELEGIIDGLKQENRILKENEAKQLESSLVRKKLAVLGSQLRKSEDSKKIYQVVVQKLLEYCQNVHDTMAGQSKSKLSAQNIAAEALETVNLVRALLERNPLPFGWEECFDENGARYFINHVTQETSWQHPVTRQTSSLADRIAD